MEKFTSTWISKFISCVVSAQENPNLKENFCENFNFRLQVVCHGREEKKLMNLENYTATSFYV